MFFERFSLLVQGFRGLGRDKKSLFFGGFSLPKKNKARKDRVVSYYRRSGLLPVAFLAPQGLWGEFPNSFGEHGCKHRSQ